MENTSHRLVPITVQLKMAKENLPSFALGAVIGTVVPVMVYAVTHKLPSLSISDKL
jgi:hypothetical protein